MRYLTFLVVFCSLAALRADDPPAALQPHRISNQLMLKYQLILSQMENIQREACDEAGIKFSKCRPQWNLGMVVESSEVKK